MAEKRKIKQGESLLELAYEGGFDSWKTVWEHEANAELRELREDPQVLLPGDEITVPERELAPKESCPVDKVHRFRLVRPRAWVNLRWQDDEGNPLARIRFVFEIGGGSYKGRTDTDGLLSIEIQPTEHRGRVTLWLEDPHEVVEIPVWVGYLDPSSSPTGARGRLQNLGLPFGPSSTVREALAALQLCCGHDLPAGDLDDETATLLEQFHDRYETL